MRKCLFHLRSNYKKNYKNKTNLFLQDQNLDNQVQLKKYLLSIKISFNKYIKDLGYSLKLKLFILFKHQIYQVIENQV